MSFRETIRSQIGDKAYESLIKQADHEVGLACQMPLVDKWGEKAWYTERVLLDEIADYYDLFQSRGLTILPTDLISIVFRCKLVGAVDSEEVFKQRGGDRLIDESHLKVTWQDRNTPVDELIERNLDLLRASLQERTLVTSIENFEGKPGKIEAFFAHLFAKMDAPFTAYVDIHRLTEEYRRRYPRLRSREEDVKFVFGCPSIGFTTSGSRSYCSAYSSAWIRTLLSLLRVASFIRPPQTDFSDMGVRVIAPTFPMFLDGTGSPGSFSWSEDEKPPWARVPDGSLFISFGYRALAKSYLDERAYGGILDFMAEQGQVFEALLNPWSKKCRGDVASVASILSSASQLPDLGAKILLVCTCLEHLFVPSAVRDDGKKYIVGGINALKPELTDWFHKLYKLRNEYAHKGTVLRDEKTLGLVRESMNNTMLLLNRKLSMT